jgi:hypothetical protein
MKVVKKMQLVRVVQLVEQEIRNQRKNQVRVVQPVEQEIRNQRKNQVRAEQLVEPEKNKRLNGYKKVTN